jgi:hypothetical protein
MANQMGQTTTVNGQSAKIVAVNATTGVAVVWLAGAVKSIIVPITSLGT